MENDNNIAAQSSGANSSKKKRIINKYSLLIIVMVFIIVILLTMLIVPYVIKSRNQGMGYKVVCDSGIIQKYNSALSSIEGGTDEVMSLAQEVKDKTDYGKDPTCVQIVYMSAVIDGDIDLARKSLDFTHNMNEKGLRPDMRLRQINSIPVMESFAERSTKTDSSETEKIEESDGRG